MNLLFKKVLSAVHVENLAHSYNVLIIIYVIIFFPRIQNSGVLIMVHIAAAAGYAAFQNIRNRWSNPLLQISTVVVPVILLGFFHYETGMFNRMIFHGFLDDVAVHLDKAIFGCQPYLFLREKMPFEWAAQFFHASYAGFYLLLVGPLMILYFKEVGKHAVYHTPAEFWQRASRVQEMLFVLMFTMLACYLVAVIIPMKGPTEHHAALFPEPRGMVAVMNYLFANGDLDGGAMPSSHVAGALVVIIYSFKYLKGWFWAALGLFVPLTLSTVYNSYHYATDIIAGLAAGWLFYSIGKRAFMFVASCRPAAR